MKSVIAITSFCAVLVGCGGGAGVANFGKHPYEVATQRHSDCVTSIEILPRPVAIDNLLGGLKDPNMLEKLILDEVIEQNVKEFMMSFDTSYQNCAQRHLEDVAAIDYRFMSLWSAVYASRMNLLTDILEGKVETYGEANKRIKAVGEKQRSDELALFAALNNEADEKKEKEKSARLEQAKLSMKQYESSMDSSTKAILEYLERSDRRRESKERRERYTNIFKSVETRTTDCTWVGQTLRCTTR